MLQCRTKQNASKEHFSLRLKCRQSSRVLRSTDVIQYISSSHQDLPVDLWRVYLNSQSSGMIQQPILCPTLYVHSNPQITKFNQPVFPKYLRLI